MRVALAYGRRRLISPISTRKSRVHWDHRDVTTAPETRGMVKSRLGWPIRAGCRPIQRPNHGASALTPSVVVSRRSPPPIRRRRFLRGTLPPCNPCGRDCLQARSRCQDGGLWAAPEALARLDCARCIPDKRATPFLTTAPLDPSSPAIFCIRPRLKLHSGS